MSVTFDALFRAMSEDKVFSKLIVTLLIVIISVFAVRFINVFLSRWKKKFITALAKTDPAAVSPAETKITITRRIVTAGIYFFAFTIFLMQFETVRTVGAGLLASAGVAGIVIGIAAQGALSNIIAGITISFSQPIRLNDAVIFDGEYGTVEEILLSHTVICTWDNRRIMVPNSVLSAKVIQNWTIKDPSLLGVVMLHVDFTCDVENVRGWVRDIVAASDYSTPEKMSCVQVVDVTEKSMVLRVLCRAADAPSAWNLRCEIREKLIAKFREEGTSLPKIRVTEMKGAAAV